MEFKAGEELGVYRNNKTYEGLKYTDARLPFNFSNPKQ